MPKLAVISMVHIGGRTFPPGSIIVCSKRTADALTHYGFVDPADAAIRFLEEGGEKAVIAEFDDSGTAIKGRR